MSWTSLGMYLVSICVCRFYSFGTMIFCVGIGKLAVGFVDGRVNQLGIPDSELPLIVHAHVEN